MRRAPTRLRSEDGFTLIEMLVAGIVLAIGIGAAVSILISSGNASTTAERHEVGVQQAEQALEQVRSLPYNQVGLTAAPPASQAAGDPPSRVSGTTFNPIGPTQEDLVLPGDPKVASPQVAPFSTVTVGSGNSTTTAKVYRFVSWRTENCNLLPVSALALITGNNGLGAINILNGLINSLTPGNPNAGVIAGLTQLISRIDGSSANLNGLLNLLVSTVLNATNGIIAKGADLRPAAQNLLNTIAQARTQAINLQNALAALSNVSLCNLDLSVLLSLRTRFRDLRTDNPTGLYAPLNSIVNGPTFNQVSSLFQGVSGVSCGFLNLQCLLQNTVGTLLVNTNNALAGVEPTLKTTLTNANSTLLTQTTQTITQLATDVAAFAASATSPTRKSSKRVVVAVVLDPAGSVGPSQPIWMTTVVADPAAGLLG